MKKYTGNGQVSESDYKKVKWVGKTKAGKAVNIEFEEAINLGNIEWSFAEKDDVVEEIVFTSVYENTDGMTDSTAEPWTVETDDTLKGAAGIMLGSGILYVNDTKFALSRGGGKFSVEREFREINADGDRGPVKDRIVMEGSRATLTMNTLQVLESFRECVVGIEEVVEEVDQ